MGKMYKEFRDRQKKEAVEKLFRNVPDTHVLVDSRLLVIRTSKLTKTHLDKLDDKHGWELKYIEDWYEGGIRAEFKLSRWICI